MALVGTDDVDGVPQPSQAARFGQELEGREQERPRVAFFLESVPPLADTAGSDERVLAPLEATQLQHLAEHEGEARGHGVDRERLAAQIGVGQDLRVHDQSEKPVIASYEGEQVGGGPDRPLAVALLIGDDVVDGGDGDVEIAGDEARELDDRVRRRRERDLQTFAGEEAPRLRRPERPVEAAREDDHLERRELYHAGRMRGRRALTTVFTLEASVRLFAIPEFLVPAPSAVWAKVAIAPLLLIWLAPLPLDSRAPRPETGFDRERFVIINSAASLCSRSA